MQALNDIAVLVIDVLLGRHCQAGTLNGKPWVLLLPSLLTFSVVVGNLGYRRYNRRILSALVKPLDVSFGPLVPITVCPADVEVGQSATFFVDWWLVLTHRVTITVSLSVHGDRGDTLECLFFVRAPFIAIMCSSC